MAILVIQQTSLRIIALAGEQEGIAGTLGAGQINIVRIKVQDPIRAGQNQSLIAVGVVVIAFDARYRCCR